MIYLGSEVCATSVLAHSSISQFARKGTLCTTEHHTHLLELALEGQTLRFYTVEVLAKSGASSHLALRVQEKLGIVREDSIR